MPNEVHLKIVLQKPVEGIVYGLQKGKGGNYKTVQAQAGNGKDLTFEFNVDIKLSNNPMPSFGGPYVQGTPGNRFVYIDIGSYAGQTGAQCSGRLKVPLPEATFQSEQESADEYIWCCTVPSSTADGKPLFAIVKPFGGWFQQKRSH